MFQKLKSWLADDTLFFTILIVLVALISFGLGRYSVLSSQKSSDFVPKAAAITITKTEPEVENPIKANDLKVVGSKSGSKYHLLDCPGAKQIKETNKIYFNSTTLAEAAGYTPASNCPGLQ